MGIACLNNACAHLQNVCRARLGLTSLPNTKYNLKFLLALQRAGLISTITRAGPRPPPPEALLSFETEPVTTANVATRRLWVGLKYHNNEPVMRNVTPISKGSRFVNIKAKSLELVTRGFTAEQTKGLWLGETMFVGTSAGILEAREAVAKNLGGMIIARVSP